MGAWGYGYDENDNYYNNVVDFAEPLIKALWDGVSNRDDLQDTRAHLMWVVKTLKSTEEEVELSRASFDTIREVVRIIREGVEETADEWRTPNEFRAKVALELEEVEEWLAESGPVGFLGGRVDALLEVLDKEGEV